MKIIVWEDRDNALTHGEGCRNAVLDECPTADVTIVYYGDPLSGAPSYVVSYSDAGYSSIYTYAGAVGADIVTRSISACMCSPTKFWDNGQVTAVANAISADLGYMSNLSSIIHISREHPADTKPAADSSYLEYCVYDEGSLSAAIARTGGILAQLIVDNPTWNIFDARSALIQTASQHPTRDRLIGYGFIDKAAATQVSSFDKPPPILCRSELQYDVALDQYDLILSWGNWANQAWAETTVVQYTSEPTGSETPADGTIVYSGTGESHIITAVADGDYWFGFFTKDSGGLYSPGIFTAGVDIDVNTRSTPSTFYFDSDPDILERDGKSWGKPFKDASQLSSAFFIDGDTIVFKGGNTVPYRPGPHSTYTYGNCLDLPDNATVILDGTGTGSERNKHNPAIFIGGDNFYIDDLTLNAGVYEAALSDADPALVFLVNIDDLTDDTDLTEAATLDACKATPLSWFSANPTLYINYGTLSPADYIAVATQANCNGVVCGGGDQTLSGGLIKGTIAGINASACASITYTDYQSILNASYNFYASAANAQSINLKRFKTDRGGGYGTYIRAYYAGTIVRLDYGQGNKNKVTGLYLYMQGDLYINNVLTLGNSTDGCHVRPRTDLNLKTRNLISAENGGVQNTFIDVALYTLDNDYSCVYVGDSGGTEYSGAWVAGPNSISADPKFIDPDNDDYRLADDSPCKRNGIFVDSMHPTIDMNGYATPVGSSPSMGPYEVPEEPKKTFKSPTRQRIFKSKAA